MKIRAVIFDLDLTLIESSAAETLRRQREWSRVYKMIPKLAPYDGVHDLFAMLKSRDIPIAVVTSSPGTYCTRVLKHWDWPVLRTVCYHDVSRRKPHPEPILKAVADLAVEASETIAVGDTADDVQSARGAKVFSVAAMWGAQDRDAVIAAKPSLICESVAELAKFVDDGTKKKAKS
jgi:HAD superfamily hydrolase (TIGR01509 family)